MRNAERVIALNSHKVSPVPKPRIIPPAQRARLTLAMETSQNHRQGCIAFLPGNGCVEVRRRIGALLYASEGVSANSIWDFERVDVAKSISSNEMTIANWEKEYTIRSRQHAWSPKISQALE